MRESMRGSGEGQAENKEQGMQIRD